MDWVDTDFFLAGVAFMVAAILITVGALKTYQTFRNSKFELYDPDEQWGD
jgi:hypothetical protein